MICNLQNKDPLNMIRLVHKISVAINAIYMPQHEIVRHLNKKVKQAGNCISCKVNKDF